MCACEVGELGKYCSKRIVEAMRRINRNPIQFKAKRGNTIIVLSILETRIKILMELLFPLSWFEKRIIIFKEYY